jgi:hypothetical protein
MAVVSLITSGFPGTNCPAKGCHYYSYPWRWAGQIVLPPPKDGVNQIYTVNPLGA